MTPTGKKIHAAFHFSLPHFIAIFTLILLSTFYSMAFRKSWELVSHMTTEAVGRVGNKGRVHKVNQPSSFHSCKGDAGAPVFHLGGQHYWLFVATIRLPCEGSWRGRKTGPDGSTARGGECGEPEVGLVDVSKLSTSKDNTYHPKQSS